MSTHANEFPTFGPLPSLVADLLAKGELSDMSWGNDVCPSFVRTADLPTVEREGSCDRVPVLWVDFADPAQREFPDGARFRVVSPSPAIPALETDSEAEAVAHLFPLASAGVRRYG